MKRAPLLLAAVAGFTSCSGQPTVPVTGTSVSERVFQRNYTLGQAQIAYVGQPVVRFKDYLVTKRRGLHMRATSDFRVKQGLTGWIQGRSDFDFPVRSTLTKEGITYLAVAIQGEGDAYLAVLVGPEGRPYIKLLENVPRAGKAVLAPGTAHFEPPHIRFLPSGEEAVVDAAAGFTNYELLYGGTDGKSFTLTYREYTPLDLIRPAFTQTLTYENHSPAIRFRNTRIEIREVTSEHVSYSVLADEAEGR